MKKKDAERLAIEFGLWLVNAPKKNFWSERWVQNKFKYFQKEKQGSP